MSREKPCKLPQRGVVYYVMASRKELYSTEIRCNVRSLQCSDDPRIIFCRKISVASRITAHASIFSGKLLFTSFDSFKTRIHINYIYTHYTSRPIYIYIYSYLAENTTSFIRKTTCLTQFTEIIRADSVNYNEHINRPTLCGKVS